MIDLIRPDPSAAAWRANKAQPAPPRSSSGVAQLPLPLSENRHADVSEFKGTTFVNVREYYTVGSRVSPASSETPKLSFFLFVLKRSWFQSVLFNHLQPRTCFSG